MRYSRQNKILELIHTHDIDTQEKLVTLLNEAGYKVTQATISKDIRDLHLVKTLGANGRYKYAVSSGNAEQPVSDRFVKVFRETVRSISSAGNIIAVKTLSGCGPAVGEAIDTFKFPHLVGSIAGDNTIFLLIDDPENIPALVERFNQIIK